MNYFDRPEISQSMLKDLKKSPKHFWNNHINPDRVKNESTEAMEFGSAVHKYLLEYAMFDGAYVVFPAQLDIRTKSGKLTAESQRQLDAFCILHAGKNVLFEKDMQAIIAISNTFKTKKQWQLLLQGGLVEHELYWTDRLTGVECRAKVDYLIEPCFEYPNGLILDLKTTKDAIDFSKSIYNFGYHNQVAYYCDAVQTIYKTNSYPDFIFIAVEKESPYEVAFYRADERLLKYGMTENSKLLELYKKCVDNNDWYGYPDEIMDISLPYWVK